MQYAFTRQMMTQMMMPRSRGLVGAMARKQ